MRNGWKSKISKIIKEINALKNVNEDKIEELKKISNEIKDEAELKSIRIGNY